MIFQKKAAVEMSVGTIVTIVLLMTTLILGLVLVRTIFSGAIENINSIDQSVKNEINKLFAEDNARKVVVYPPSRLIIIKKGNKDYLGFAFSIRNVETISGKFDYTITVNDPDLKQKCNINLNEVENWIQVGRAGSVTIPPGSSMQDPEFVRFLIPETAPPCTVRYGINVEKDNVPYGTTVSVDVKIEAE
ncbi:MAG TPA: hypothetical protein VJZ93_02135 [Candidatus Nanoarchaeia archaeon]|nr:hypothetical protein [Candidatus Nanoarchaeia archaeon]